MTELAQRRCIPCEGGIKPHDAASTARLMADLRQEWQLINEGRALQAKFSFKNYYHTTAFVNAVAYIAHREDHHPDISFGYRDATITWWTHAINGLSDNDFICAAKVDTLL